MQTLHGQGNAKESYIWEDSILLVIYSAMEACEPEQRASSRQMSKNHFL